MSWLDRLLKREASLTISIAPKSWTHFIVITKPAQRVILEASFDHEGRIEVLDPLMFYAWMAGSRLRPLQRWRGMRIEGNWLPPRPDHWVFVVRAIDEDQAISGQLKMKLGK